MLLISFLFLLSSAALAEDKILVTATRSNTNSTDLPFSVSTVGGERWQAAGGQAENALAAVPGLAFTANGGSGQIRYLSIRGAKAEHTLVLIDGIPFNDPLSPSRAFDFGQILVSDIERIEVIKGPQSVLYGSDAMGGVVNIITRKNTNTRLRLEGGSYGTLKANASLLGFHAGMERSDGFSAADERDGNTEADRHSAWNLGGRQEFKLSSSTLLSLNGEFKESKTDTDRSGGRGGDSRGTFARTSLFLLRAEALTFLPAEYEWVLAGSYAGHDRDDNTNTLAGDYYKAGLGKVESILRKTFGNHALSLGAEYAEESGRSSQTTGGQRTFRSVGLFLQDQISFERFHANLGGRLDTHSQHENAQTYRLGLGYWLMPELLRLKSSVGTGFKAPSLYQTYSIYGSPLLKPEKSLGADFGAELTGEDWQTGLTAFSNRFRDQIDFNPATSRYFNQSRAETYGLEWEAEKRFGLFRLANAATWMRAFDRDTRLELLRRPRFTNTLSFGYRKGDLIGANLTARYVGRRTDSHPTLFSRQPMPEFTVLGFDMFHHLGGAYRITARAENLLNRQYQETSGFGVPALSGYIGLEAEL